MIVLAAIIIAVISFYSFSGLRNSTTDITKPTSTSYSPTVSTLLTSISTSPSAIHQTSTYTCPQSGAAYTGTLPTDNNDFWIQVNYSGSWTGTIKAENSLAPVSDSVVCLFGFSGTDNESTILPPWNVNGEELVWADVTKLDSSNANLTLTVGNGNFQRSNSTIAPNGSTQIWTAVAP